MGPILAAKAKLDADIKDGRKKPSDTLSAYFVTMTDPEHRYEGYVVRMAPAPRRWPNPSSTRTGTSSR